MLLFVVSALVSGPAFSLWPSQGEESVAADGDDGDSPCRSSCPGDDENGECPPECDACPCCPSAASPGVSLVGILGSAPASIAQLQAPSGLDEDEEGARTRVFHPPRSVGS